MCSTIRKRTRALRRRCAPLASSFGDGLVAVDGEQHKRQRRAVGPGFSTSVINGMMRAFRDLTEKLAARRHKSCDGAPSGSGINAYGDFEKLFMDIIGETGFQYKFGSLEGHRSELEAAFVDVTQHAATGSLYSLLRSQFPSVETLGHWFVREQIKLNRLRRTIQHVSIRLLKNARAHFEASGGEKLKSRRKDILALLVQANLQEDATHRLDDDEIVSIIPTLLSRGYDNNASGMAHAVMVMAQTPSTQKRLQKELLAPPPRCENWKSDWKALDSLPYLDAI